MMSKLIQSRKKTPEMWKVINEARWENRLPRHKRDSNLEIRYYRAPD